MSNFRPLCVDLDHTLIKTDLLYETFINAIKINPLNVIRSIFWLLKGKSFLKKKLFEAILTAAEDLGDPTDPENGWDVKFKRVKTGPLPYNVEYQLQALKCKTRALTEDELDLISDLKSMDEVMPRPTPDAQKELLDRIRDAGAEEIDETIEEEFNIA